MVPARCYNTPTVLMGIPLIPYFSTVRLSLLDRGFIYAIAHVRGGEYLGRNWYDEGRLLQEDKYILPIL